MRCTLSPSFTSSKMRIMFNLICQNANVFTQYFSKKEDEIIEVEFKDAFTRFTNDVIANTAFGIEVDSLQDRENQFFLMGKGVNDFSSFWKKMKMLFIQICPKLSALLGLTIFEKDLTHFFKNLVKDTIKLREENNIRRSDMLGLLMEARKGRGHEHTDDIKENSFAAVKEHFEMQNTNSISDTDIASQAFIFFLAGYESIARSMCFLVYELAINSDVQNRLYEEITENIPTTGEPTYETILNMTYLDMVVTENLRKWPVAMATDRIVTKPYTIQPELPEEHAVELNVGLQIFIPIYGIHRDPTYYENPEKFDPERFSPENRKNIDPYTYLPFGIGPRNCIASRFALLEMKCVLYYLLLSFEIIPVEKTEIPLQIPKSIFDIMPKNGFPLGLKRRS
ncbi:hypothetical protein HHI36_015313 [Cryptolaemus montrouzieri]|uniref:Cytochrome P450 n=1 Tax=Cryptolaemus montrouzieri TaxID=559131 RepID=A0ABD2N5B9_9CUCU